MPAAAEVQGKPDPELAVVADQPATPAVWTVTTLGRGLGVYRMDWERLQCHAAPDAPALSAAFIDALLRHFGDGSEHICSLRRGDQLTALVVVQPIGGSRWTAFAPPSAPASAALVRDTSALAALLHQLPGRAVSLLLPRLDPSLLPCTPWPAQFLVVRMCVDLECVLLQDRGASEGASHSPLRPGYSTQNDDQLEHRRFDATTPEAYVEATARYANLLRDSASPASLSVELINTWPSSRVEVHELRDQGRVLAVQPLLRMGRRIAVLPVASATGSSALPGLETLRERLMSDLLDRYPGHAVGSLDTFNQADLGDSWLPSASFSARRVTLDVQVFRSPLRRALAGLPRRNDGPRATRDDLMVTQYGTLEALPDTVIDLFGQVEKRGGIQAGLPWLQLLASSVFRHSCSVQIFVLQRGKQAVAVLPLVVLDDQPRVVQFLRNYYSSLVVPPLAHDLRPSDLAPLLTAVASHWPRAAEWRLDPMDPQGFEFQLLRAALAQSGWMGFTYFRFGNWYLPSGDLGWAEYIRGRKAGLRSTLSRMGKKLAALEGRLELICAGDRVSTGIQAYEQAYAASWKQAEPHPEFVRELMLQCAARGTLRLGVAWLGDRAIAAQIWLVQSGRAEIFKVAYDESHKALSIGTLVTAMVLEHVLEHDNVVEVDYLTGDDAYKRTWMSARRERWGLVAYAIRRPRGLLGGLREASGRVARSGLAWLSRRRRSA